MTTFNELKSAIWNNTPLVWNDPDPIEGNDYTISWIEPISEDDDEHTPILIQYGEGSEAQVFLHEILKKI
jgi:hypothetical protein